MSERYPNGMDEDGQSVGGSIPCLEDNWEIDPETGEEVWAPFMLVRPPLPGFPGPDRYGYWPGRFKDGKRIEKD